MCEKQLFHLVDRVKQVDINHDEINEFIPAIVEKLNDLDKEELIKRFVSVEFNRFLTYYQDARDLNVYKKDLDKSFGKGKGSNGKYSRLFINVGKVNSLTAPRLMGVVNENSKRRKIRFGKIEILKNFSFFEVEEGSQNDVIKFLQGKSFEGEKLQVEHAIAKPQKKNSFKRNGKKFESQKKRKFN